MSIPLTREKVLEIIAEEKQKLQDDRCNSKKHTLGKKANLISKGLRVCCKKSDKNDVASIGRLTTPRAFISLFKNPDERLIV